MSRKLLLTLALMAAVCMMADAAKKKVRQVAIPEPQVRHVAIPEPPTTAAILEDAATTAPAVVEAQTTTVAAAQALLEQALSSVDVTTSVPDTTAPA